jgi:hypothetical protein
MGDRDVWSAQTGCMTVDTGYTTDKDPSLRNPERGMYFSRLPDTEDFHTIVNRWLWLDTVCGEDLTWEGLNDVRTTQKLKDYAQQLEECRAAGVKVLFRPRYDKEGTNSTIGCTANRLTVFHADTKARQINHIDAIAAMLGDYRDVIAYIQAGYLGCWGEWNTAAEGAGPSNAPLLHNREDRNDIMDHILSAYTAHGIEQHVELRRPVFAKAAIRRDPNANVGLHNDCFMTNESDRGTYSNFDDSPANFASSAAAKLWAQEFTVNHSFGGETCPIDEEPGTERWRKCSNMVSEDRRSDPATLHMNYLFGEHAPDAMKTWEEGGCYPEIRRKLGYRFKVKRVEYTQTVASGQNFAVTIDIENSGWARLHKRRDAMLVLRSGSTTHVYPLSNGDTRSWAPGTTSQVSVTDAPPPRGTYELRLSIFDPDTDADSPMRIPYAVKLASLRHGVNVFDGTTGENNLDVSIIVQ